MSGSQHKDRYKNQGLNATEMRRRREEEGIQLRKQKREQQLAKRRNVAESVVGGEEDAIEVCLSHAHPHKFLMNSLNIIPSKFTIMRSVHHHIPQIMSFSNVLGSYLHLQNYPNGLAVCFYKQLGDCPTEFDVVETNSNFPLDLKTYLMQNCSFAPNLFYLSMHL